MSDYLDILAQKYLDGDCSQAELDEISRMEGDSYWQDLLAKYQQIEHDLKKQAYLSNVKGTIASSPRKNRVRLVLVAAVAAIIVGVAIVPMMADQEQDNQIASNSEDKKQESKSAEMDGAAEEDSKGDATEASETVSDIEFRDVEIVENQSIYNFEHINGAFKDLKESADSHQDGVVGLVIAKNNTDSVYVFSVSYDDFIYEKHLRYVGKTKDKYIFNLISYKGDERETRRAILIFNEDITYLGRFIVSTVDHLPDYIESDQLVFEHVGLEGRRFKVPFNLEKDDCIDLPEGMTSCLSKF